MAYSFINYWADIMTRDVTIVASNRNIRHVICHIECDSDNPSCTIDLAHITTGEDNLVILNTLLHCDSWIRITNLVDHYIRMKFMRCLEMLLTVDTNYDRQDITIAKVIEHAFRNTDMALLKLIKPCNRTPSKYSPTKSNCIMNEPIVVCCEMTYRMTFFGCTMSLKRVTQRTSLAKRKMLIQYALMHKHQYALPLFKSIMTQADYVRLLLVEELFTSSLLQDAYHNHFYFIFIVLLSR